MRRLSKSISAAARVHESYVRRHSNSTFIGRIGKIEPAEPTENSYYGLSENYLLGYENYYRNVTQARSFSPSLHHDLFSKLSPLNKDIFRQLIELVNKYNDLIEALQSFDTIAGTDYSNNIHHAFIPFAATFSTIGIFAQDDYSLSIDPAAFLSFLYKNSMPFSHVISQFQQSILKKYRSLMHDQAQNKRIAAYTPFPWRKTGLLIDANG